jgi:hypothetical protein
MDLLRAFTQGFGKRLTRQEQAPQPADEPPRDVIKEPPMQIVGRVLSADAFVAYIEGLAMPQPRPTRLFLHHTWKPTRETWNGNATILGMKAYYERQLWQDAAGRWHEGWTAGPHLFVADDGIWLFSDLRWDGVGVYGHNYRTRHLEMVGNYDAELPSGATLANTVAALGAMCACWGLDPQALAFHRDFSTKTCPGTAVTKQWIIPQVQAWVANYRQAQARGELRRRLEALLGEALPGSNLPLGPNPQAALARAARERGLLGAITDEIPIEIGERAYVVQMFAEALLVPVNQWDQVRSLDEVERATASAADAGAEAAGSEPVDHHLATRPADPFDYRDVR